MTVRSFWMRNPLLQKNWWNSFFPTCKRKGGQGPWGYFCWNIFKWHFHRTHFLYTFNPRIKTWWKWIHMRMKHGSQQYSYTHLCVIYVYVYIYISRALFIYIYICIYTHKGYVYIMCIQLNIDIIRIYIYTYTYTCDFCQWYACKTKPDFVETLTFTYLPEEFPSFANQQKTSAAQGLLLRKRTCRLKNSGFQWLPFLADMLSFSEGLIEYQCLWV